MEAAGSDPARLAELTLSVWRRGGADSLVKVLPLAAVVDPAAPVGLCTTLRFLLGKVPAEMSAAAGWADPVALFPGADVFGVSPLPEPGDFSLRRYATGPHAAAAQESGPPLSHPIYPPSRGAPLWDLSGVTRARLTPLARIPRAQVFRYETRRLPSIG